MTPALAHRLRDERGFTLIELLETMALLGIFFALFATVITMTITHGTQEQETTVLQTEARASLERFAQELRQANTGVDGQWPIASVSTATNTIRFFSPDRLQPYHMREIEWRLSSGELQRRSVTSTDTDGSPWVYPTALSAVAWTTQARSIRNATIFQFLDGSEPPAATTNAANVRKVTITLQISTVGQASRTTTYETSVKPRVTP